MASRDADATFWPIVELIGQCVIGLVEVQSGIPETFCVVVAAERAKHNDEGNGCQNCDSCAMGGIVLFHDDTCFDDPKVLKKVELCTIVIKFLAV